ncbi:MAG: FG-GAP repeat domain-containing protein, partial [Cyclobacteriaceae bacterium]
ITRQAGITHSYRENEFNDFKYQVLLPHKMSQEGPAVAVADVNGDNLDDFYIGGAKGFAGKLFIQKTNGTFRESNAPWAADTDSEDAGAVFFDANGNGHPDLYVVSGGYEFTGENPALQDRLYLNDGQGNFSKAKDALPQFLVSGSCVVPSDFDKDGDIDLFVGGRQVPDQYPLPAKSVLLRNDGGKFTDVTAKLAPQLENPGMVTAAEWSDVDGDGRQDLIIVGEWMPVTIFKNSKNGFTNISEEVLPEKTNGWYFSLLAADVDQDGDQDLITGNLGLNHRYQASKDSPFEIYAADFDSNGDIDPVLAYHYDNRLFPFEGRNKLFDQMTMIKRQFTDYQSFAEATMQQIFGQAALDSAYNLKTYDFASKIFVNDGTGKFTSVRQLPNLAQIAPVNTMIYADINQDGTNDLLIAGNLYETEHQTPRIDAGKGWFLQGTGSEFQVIPNHESGLNLQGAVKHIRLIRMANGQKGLLVVRNNDKTNLIKINSPAQVTGL